MRVKPETFTLNGRQLKVASMLPDQIDFAEIASKERWTPPPREPRKKKEEGIGCGVRDVYNKS